MRRAVAVILHNWPLKVGAVVLATVLYGGLILTQNANTWTGRIGIEPRNQPTDAILLSMNPTDVTEIRYFAPAGVPVSSNTFIARADLSGIPPGSGSTFVPVTVEPTDDRIRILEFQPTTVRVELDPLTSKAVPIKVDLGQPPTGLEIGTPEVSDAQTTVSGPQSLVDRVVSAAARVTIQPSGLDVDQDVPLIALDALGNAVSPVDLSPGSVHVKIRVGSAAESKTLPVNAVVAGTPASGFAVGDVSIDPVAVTVQGEADALAALAKVDTAPVDVGGATSDVTATVDLVLPNDVESLGPTSVTVTVAIEPVSATRTYSAGILLAGARDDRTYSLSTDRVTVVLGGPVSELDRLEPTSFTATVDVSALPPGHAAAVPVTIANLPAGLSVVSISPPTIAVDVGVVAASPSPSPSLAPTPSPSPS